MWPSLCKLSRAPTRKIKSVSLEVKFWPKLVGTKRIVVGEIEGRGENEIFWCEGGWTIELGGRADFAAIGNVEEVRGQQIEIFLVEPIKKLEFEVYINMPDENFKVGGGGANFWEGEINGWLAEEEKKLVGQMVVPNSMWCKKFGEHVWAFAFWKGEREGVYVGGGGGVRMVKDYSEDGLDLFFNNLIKFIFDVNGEINLYLLDVGFFLEVVEKQEIEAQRKLSEPVKIGGLKREIREGLESICKLWSLPAELRHRIGLRIPRGILLWGPPGTGKTLLARYISKMIHNSKLQIVRGPEILSKWMGESESGVRGWFKEAFDEWAKRRWESDLHIIVIDEIDSLMRSREGRIGDTVVTQFLAMIDGIDTPPNIMIIGTTNHLELVDPAVRRPGRLELSFEMSYVQGKEDWCDICKIHLEKLWDHEAEKYAEVLWKERDQSETCWTGAKIEALVQRKLLEVVAKMDFKFPSSELDEVLKHLRDNW